MATIRDVAREAGVSVASASRALNGHDNVTPDLRARVEAAASKLSYVPHWGARSLTRRTSDAIGVVLPDLFGEFFSELVRGIDRVAHAHGKQLLLSNMHGNPHEAAHAVRAMRGRVDGLLVMTSDLGRENLFEALSPLLPAVLLNCHETTPGIASVGIDNEGAARTMTRHLVTRGYRRIAFVSGPRHNRDSMARQAGFRAALIEATGERDPIVIPGDYSETSGAEAARLLIAGRLEVDAIFCANDMMAVGCCGVLAEAGIAIGEEVGVAGFDDIPIAHYTAPALTTMNVRIDELGATAAEKLIALMSGADLVAETTILSPQLVERDSTRRATATPSPPISHLFALEEGTSK
ncbi:MAG: LacI family transcriptional regulator [Pseudomonadota bacterium]|nr:LacI family transcriptional regulator [Pseudomonadota bacterium]